MRAIAGEEKNNKKKKEKAKAVARYACKVADNGTLYILCRFRSLGCLAGTAIVSTCKVERTWHGESARYLTPQKAHL